MRGRIGVCFRAMSDDSSPISPHLEDAPGEIASDMAAVARMAGLPTILALVSDVTGMRFAAVARVTEATWTACAVHDGAGLGIKVGDQLEAGSALCGEARRTGAPIVFDGARAQGADTAFDPLRALGIASYVSAPIRFEDGWHFGNLCAADPEPGRARDSKTAERVWRFAEIIAAQLRGDERFAASELARLGEKSQSNLREHFIAVLGHDLRNPLSALAASSELVRRNSQDAKVLRATEVMGSSIRRMSALIDDVLDFARARLGGGIGARLVQSDGLGRALKDVCAEIQAAHPDARVEEAIEVEGPVDCDPGRMQQLLSNLLGNAIAHGDLREPIVVDATIQVGWLTMSVSNGGPPIPPESLARVFEPYWRPASSGPGGGLGLGLYICQQIAMAHGGSMSAASADGATRFSVRIPIRAD